MSLAAHLVFLLWIAFRAPYAPLDSAEALATDEESAGSSLMSTTTWVDLLTPPPEMASLPPPLPVAVALAVADQTRVVETPTSPGIGSTPEQAVPAPDQGSGTGRRQTGAAFRRDRSTLHTRISDGAEVYQRSRERTGAVASSPQPIREEPVVGTGDSSRSRQPRPEVSAPIATLLPRSPEEAEGEVLVDPEGAHPRDEGASAARGQGPLDAEKGPRRFDVENQGVARETAWSRAASDESHAGRLELSAPSVAGPGDEGRGPGQAPGASSRPDPGTAPAARGAEQAVDRGAAVALSTAEREYHRFQAEIRRRVASALRFPKRLALLLEQGETVVHFVVNPDGRLSGVVRIIKSAGFAEFDAEAISAVTRAAPFPPTGRALSVSMPIAFDNPVVR